MNETDIRKRLSINASSLIGGLGNCSYLYAHIEYFENKLATEIASYEQNLGDPYLAKLAYQNCSNFVAWIRLYPEFICNRAMASLSRSEKCETNFTDYTFRQTAKKIFILARDNHRNIDISEVRLNEKIKAFKLTIELRHTIQHGGLPSVLRGKPKFDGIDLEEVAEMANPLKYRETKKIFSDANELIQLLPEPVIVFMGDGEIKFRDEKDSKIRHRPAKA